VNQDCNPQVEDGYVRIANELLEALSRIRLPGRQWQIVLTVIRMTYGFNRKTWKTTNVEIARMLGMKRQNTHADLDELSGNNVLLVIENDDGKGITIGIEKHYQNWTCYRNRLPSSKTITSVIENDYRSSSKTITAILLKTKDNSKDNVVHLPAAKKEQTDRVPFLEIAQAWNDILGDTLPTVNPALLTDKRKAPIAARWHTSDNTQSVEWWREFFTTRIATSDFLMGRSRASPGRVPWRAKFDWVFKLDNFVKIMEDHYE
jgi:phage replication O-like protein O